MSRNSARVRERLSSLTRPPPCKMGDTQASNTKPIAKYVEDVLKGMEGVPKWAKPLNLLLSILGQHQEALEKDCKESKEKCERLGNRVSFQESTIKALKDKIASLEAENSALRSRAIESEAYSRRDNLLFYGIKEDAWETPALLRKKLDEQVLSKLNIPNYSSIKVVRIHRLYPKRVNQQKPRPLIVRFHFYGDREAILNASSKLKGTGLYISEDFPKEIQAERRRLFPFFMAAKKKFGRQAVKLKKNKLVLPDGTYTVDNLHEFIDGLKPNELALSMSDTHAFYFTKDTVLSNFNSETPFKVGNDNFNCSEQYIQMSIADYFKDDQAVKDIKKMTNPMDMKNRGKSVKNYDQERWIQVCKERIKPGILAKFSQNEGAKQVLLSTGTRIIAEASPHDKIYGIGIAIHDEKRHDASNWGDNLMGQILVDVRNELCTT